MNRGFTLIEMLVVVTIIVVLLALLAPALDKAIYQAELAVCGANLRSVAHGLSVYAVGNRRYYPQRSVATMWAFTVDIKRGGLDDRPSLRQVIPLKTLQDPLLKTMDLDTQNSGWIQDGFASLFYGVRYPGEAVMRKLGDHFSWTATGTSGQPVTHMFDVVACDSEYIATPSFFASHPDIKEVLWNGFGQDALAAWEPQSLTTTYSYWTRQDGQVPGRMDLNFAQADGSVVRYNGVEAPVDDRMEHVPSTLNNEPAYVGWWVQLPRQ